MYSAVTNLLSAGHTRMYSTFMRQGSQSVALRLRRGGFGVVDLLKHSVGIDVFYRKIMSEKMGHKNSFGRATRRENSAGCSCALQERRQHRIEDRSFCLCPCLGLKKVVVLTCPGSEL